MSAVSWHPVALSADLAPGTAAPARLDGIGIVLWREAEGALHAWEDRCPHRGMRLSFGFVRGGRLTCLYHGWQFDTEARCRHIPAHPELKVPGTIRASAWHVREQAGLVWLARPDAPEAEPLLPEAETLPVRSLAVLRPFDEVATRLGIGRAGWIWRGSTLLALHAPDGATTMLHVATHEAAPEVDRNAAFDEATQLRTRLEAA